MIKHTEINSDLRGYILIVVALAGMSGILLDFWSPVNPIYSTYWRCYSPCLCHFVLARKQMEARLYHHTLALAWSMAFCNRFTCQ